MRVALCCLRFQTASAMRQERGNLVRYYSELNLNQYSVGSPCRTICTVFGSPPCPDLNLIHYIFKYYHARHEMAVSAAAFGQYYARHGRYPETLAAAGLGGKISCLRYHWIDGKPLLLCKDPLLLFEHYQYDFQHRRWLEDNGEPVADQPEDET